MEVPQVAKRDGLPPAVARLSEEPQRLVQVWLRVRQLPEPVVRDSDVLVGLRELRGIPGLLADREGRAVARERLFQLPMLIVNEIGRSTRLNSSHTVISYAVFCLKKKKNSATTLLPVIESQ